MTTDKEIIVFCENIKKLMERHSLTREEMAGIIGISVKGMESIENCVMPKSLGVNNLLTLCTHFGLAPNQMFSPL